MIIKRIHIKKVAVLATFLMYKYAKIVTEIFNLIV